MDNFNDYYFNLPGRVVEYFPADQTATIRICAERNFDSSTVLGERNTRGLLEDVPVHTASGGGWAITFPIKVGDTCILFFSQVGYDHWLYEDKDEAGTFNNQPMPWTSRRFNLQDGYALVGLSTLPRKIAGVSATDSQWRNTDSTQMISLKEDGSINVVSSSTVTVTAPNVNIVASTKVTITAPEAEITGNLSVGGDVVATGEITGNGVALSTHVHVKGVGTSTQPPT